MTLPASLLLSSAALVAQRTGIALGFFPADTTSSIEIQRAPDSSGNPDTANAATIAVVPPGTTLYIDGLALTGARFHYRIRHTGLLGDPSDWTYWVDAIPGALASDLERGAPVTPWLTVRPVESATQVVIYWEGYPYVELAINGGAAGTPSASPITVSKNAAGGAKKTYHFATVGGDLSQAQSATVVVFPQEASPPAAPRITSAYVSAADNPGDGGGSVEITFAWENMPVGHYFTIEVVPTQGDPITDSGGEIDTPVTSSPHTVSIALGADAQVDVTITARDSGGVELDEYFFSSGVLPA